MYRDNASREGSRKSAGMMEENSAILLRMSCLSRFEMLEIGLEPEGWRRCSDGCSSGWSEGRRDPNREKDVGSSRLLNIGWECGPFCVSFSVEFKIDSGEKNGTGCSAVMVDEKRYDDNGSFSRKAARLSSVSENSGSTDGAAAFTDVGSASAWARGSKCSEFMPGVAPNVCGDDAAKAS